MSLRVLRAFPIDPPTFVRPGGGGQHHDSEHVFDCQVARLPSSELAPRTRGATSRERRQPAPEPQRNGNGGGRRARRPAGRRRPPLAAYGQCVNTSPGSPVQLSRPLPPSPVSFPFTPSTVSRWSSPCPLSRSSTP